MLVKTVQNPVNHRRGKQAHHRHHDQCAKEGIEAGENLQNISGIPLGIKVAGSAQEHARFEKCIYEIQLGDRHVAEHSDAERRNDKTKSQEKLSCHAAEKNPVRGKRLVMVLPKNHSIFIAGAGITLQTKSWPFKLRPLPLRK